MVMNAAIPRARNTALARLTNEEDSKKLVMGRSQPGMASMASCRAKLVLKVTAADMIVFAAMVLTALPHRRQTRLLRRQREYR